MNNKILISGVIVVVALIAGIILLSRGTTQTSPANNTTTNTNQTPTASAMEEKQESTSEAKKEETVKSFTITGTSFAFDPKQIKVKKGDTVRITFKDNEGIHNFMIDKFNIKTKKLQPGESETVEFVADIVGTYPYYCSVGNHRAQGMEGTLVVE